LGGGRLETSYNNDRKDYGSYDSYSSGSSSADDSDIRKYRGDILQKGHLGSYKEVGKIDKHGDIFKKGPFGSYKKVGRVTIKEDDGKD